VPPAAKRAFTPAAKIIADLKEIAFTTDRFVVEAVGNGRAALSNIFSNRVVEKILYRVTDV